MNAWLEALTGLYLQDPWFLLLLPALPLLRWWRRRRGQAALLFAPFRFLGGAGSGHGDLAPLPRRWRTRLLWLPTAASMAALVLAIVALARPVQRSLQPQPNLGIDILLCLDVSSSMAQRDLDGVHSRLDVAKAAAAQFVRGRGEDRVGLCTFARFADVRCPPTLDHEALLAMLAGVAQVASDGPEDATGIGMAVARSAQVLQRSVARAKVIVLLTDGEENVATDDAKGEIAPKHAAQLCQQLGVRVYAIAIGAGRNRGGASQPLDTKDLDELAQRTGGRCFSARDAAALAQVYAAIDSLEKAPVVAPLYLATDRGLGFVLAALACWLLGWLLRATGLEVLP